MRDYHPDDYRRAICIWAEDGTVPMFLYEYLAHMIAMLKLRIQRTEALAEGKKP